MCMFSCLFATENVGNHVPHNNKQYICGMNISISISTFSVSNFFFLVWFFLYYYFRAIWMSTLRRQVMAEPVSWTLLRVRISFLSKCACFETCLIPELGHLLTLKRCIFFSDNMRCRSHFLAFFPCEWKAIWYTEYPAKAFNWKAEQKAYGTA